MFSSFIRIYKGIAYKFLCNFTESSIYFYYLLCYDALAETMLYTLQK